MNPQKIYRCKFCKCEVHGKKDLNPVYPLKHSKSCPRAKRYNP